MTPSPDLIHELRAVAAGRPDRAAGARPRDRRARSRPKRSLLAQLPAAQPARRLVALPAAAALALASAA